MRHAVPLVLLTTLVFCLSACNSGSSSSSRSDTPTTPSDQPLNRYEMANACWVLKAEDNERYIALGEDGYTASALTAGQAEPFYLKPTALGSYMLYNSNRELMTVEESALTNIASASAHEGSEWTVRVQGDTTEYPASPEYDQEPNRDQVTAWHNESNYRPEIRGDSFTLTSEDDTSPENHQHLGLDTDGAMVAVTDAAKAQNFRFERASGCAEFPEAQSNFTGEPFKGKRPDGTVLGHADVHVHISATEFLGGGHSGYPFHKFGVEHALGNCDDKHGEGGYQDFIGGLWTEDPSGHNTDGWPTFTDWPAAKNLTHEAIYWKWLERAWAGGLRVVVNDLVDNETLCELQRNAVNDPTRDCNPMNNAGEQAGTMYAMENYIDAQYGGPGKGFFQIVHSSEEARRVIEAGKIAVVLGIEISNLFNCKLTYNPLRQEPPKSEPGEGDAALLTENRYGCTTEEGKPNSILTQMQRIHDWGVRQVISIHEFDNAFGGNGIFNGLLLNLGNRENSGGIPSEELAPLGDLLAGEFGEEQGRQIAENLPTTETATGEWWTTYNCPEETSDSDNPFSGYLWADSGGSTQFEFQGQSFPACVPTGQGGRYGGTTPCYPDQIPQCNARWMTPTGLYTYSKLMEMGFIFDWDHMEMGMKTQALELAESQNPAYPFVSTHGTYGGTSNNQAIRLLANGGFLYPSNGSSAGFIGKMDETLGIYQQAMALRGQRSQGPLLFGFGYGTDTNGMSDQTSSRDNPEKPITYPFRLFEGEAFSKPEFSGISPVEFQQPNSVDIEGKVVRSWHEDEDGNAHYGMLSDFVQEIALDGSPEHIQHLYNSAEAFLQTWERTEAASAAIRARGGVGLEADPDKILREAPNSGQQSPRTYCEAIGSDC